MMLLSQFTTLGTESLPRLMSLIFTFPFFGIGVTVMAIGILYQKTHRPAVAFLAGLVLSLLTTMISPTLLNAGVSGVILILDVLAIADELFAGGHSHESRYMYQTQRAPRQVDFKKRADEPYGVMKNIYDKL